MTKLLQNKLLLGMAMAIAPSIVSAQIDQDLPLSVSAGCFSVCLSNVNVKGVQGTVSVTNLDATRVATMTGTVKVQCNGNDVPGATQALGPVNVNPTQVGNIPYSISFSQSAACAYTVVTTVSSSIISRSSTTSTGFAADCIDQPCGTEGCTLTQGYWKNHETKWPVTSLTLGTKSYTQAELLKILTQPVKGNGLVSLAHQLIAAKLNIANGAACTSINATIAAADTAIGSLLIPPVGGGSLSTSSVGNLVTALDQFNNGLKTSCAGHCSQ